MRGDFDRSFISAVSRLRSQWDRAQAEWQDETARKFEHEMWRCLDEETTRVAAAISELEIELADIANALDDSF